MPERLSSHDCSSLEFARRCRRLRQFETFRELARRTAFRARGPGARRDAARAHSKPAEARAGPRRPALRPAGNGAHCIRRGGVAFRRSRGWGIQPNSCARFRSCKAPRPEGSKCRWVPIRPTFPGPGRRHAVEPNIRSSRSRFGSATGARRPAMSRDNVGRSRAGRCFRGRKPGRIADRDCCGAARAVSSAARAIRSRGASGSSSTTCLNIPGPARAIPPASPPDLARYGQAVRRLRLARRSIHAAHPGRDLLDGQGIVLHSDAIGAFAPGQLGTNWSAADASRFRSTSPALSLNYGFIVKRGRMLSPAARAFMEFVRRSSDQSPWSEPRLLTTGDWPARAPGRPAHKRTEAKADRPETAI